MRLFMLMKSLYGKQPRRSSLALDEQLLWSLITDAPWLVVANDGSHYAARQPKHHAFYTPFQNYRLQVKSHCLRIAVCRPDHVVRG